MELDAVDFPESLSQLIAVLEEAIPRILNTIAITKRTLRLILIFVSFRFVFFIGFFSVNFFYLVRLKKETTSTFLFQKKNMMDWCFSFCRVMNDKGWQNWQGWSKHEPTLDLYPTRLLPHRPFWEWEWFQAVVISDPTLIVDKLYLGSSFNAASWSTLERLNIGLVVNCASEIQNYFEGQEGVEYHNISILDNNQDSISDALEPAFEKIDQMMKSDSKKNVLVHCFAGSSRSCAVVLYYLCKTKQWDFEKALEYVRQHRPMINPTVKLVREIKLRLQKGTE